MNSLNNGGDRVPLALSYHQMELSVMKLGYIQLNFWPKGSYENPPATQANAKTICGFSTNDRRVPIAEDNIHRTH